MYICIYDPALIQVFLYNPIMIQNPACSHLNKSENNKNYFTMLLQFIPCFAHRPLQTTEMCAH